MPTDSNCIFCKVIGKQIPSKLVKEHDRYIVIRDINPQAPTHLLIVPKEHIPNITACRDALFLGQLFQAAGEIAEEQQLAAGFRLVVNTGSDGGQTVDHLHIHLLAGRALSWPPG